MSSGKDFVDKTTGVEDAGWNHGIDRGSRSVPITNRSRTVWKTVDRRKGPSGPGYRPGDSDRRSVRPTVGGRTDPKEDRRRRRTNGSTNEMDGQIYRPTPRRR